MIRRPPRSTLLSLHDALPICFGAGDSALAGMQHSPVRAQAVAESGALQDEVAALIFTSGTTGTPKGVMVGHDALTLFARVSAASRGLGPQDRSYRSEERRVGKECRSRW